MQVGDREEADQENGETFNVGELLKIQEGQSLSKCDDADVALLWRSDLRVQCPSSSHLLEILGQM